METRNIEALIKTWSDQKLSVVMAFNEDGRMEYTNPCECLLGVHSSSVPHSAARCSEEGHYIQAKYGHADEPDEYLFSVELEYRALGGRENSQSLRNIELGKLLQAEMIRREAVREVELPELELVGA